MSGKRIFDILFSFTGLLLAGWLIIVFFIVACADTRSFGLFIQERIGRYGKKFKIVKLKTMREGASGTKCISGIGAFLRKTKIDELPQLLNILAGDMSVVGPRPDIAGYYDLLKGEDRQVLNLKPGITGPASLKYRNEEALLELQPNPLKYNDEVIFPDKVRINIEYLHRQNFLLDIRIILCTLFNIKFKEIL